MNQHIETLIKYWTVLDNIKQDKQEFINIYKCSGRRSYGRDIMIVEQYFDDVYDKVFRVCEALIRHTVGDGGLSEKEKAIIDKFVEENSAFRDHDW